MNKQLAGESVCFHGTDLNRFTVLISSQNRERRLKERKKIFSLTLSSETQRSSEPHVKVRRRCWRENWARGSLKQSYSSANSSPKNLLNPINTCVDWCFQYLCVCCPMRVHLDNHSWGREENKVLTVRYIVVGIFYSLISLYCRHRPPSKKSSIGRVL